MECVYVQIMDFAGLNAVSQSAFLPKKKWTELEEDKFFTVSKIRHVNTRFGKKIVIEIANSFQLFLPPRVLEFLENNPKSLEDIEDAAQKMKLSIYHYRNGAFEFKID